MRRTRVRRIAMKAMRAVGRFAVRSLIAMDCIGMGMPEFYEVSADRYGGGVSSPEEPSGPEQFRFPRHRARRLSAAERRAWSDIEQRLQ